MNFSDLLNNYLNILDSSAKELSTASNLGYSTICRYLNGERVPKFSGSAMDSLINGLGKLALEKNIKDITTEKITEDIIKTLECMDRNTTDFDIIRRNLKFLIDGLDISTNKMAKAMDIDASFLYRVFSGKRTPFDENKFVDMICRYITKNFSDEDSKKYVASLISVNASDIADEDTYLSALRYFVITNTSVINPAIKFLKKLDEFNLDEYINSIHFNDIDVPTVPFKSKTFGNYFGLEEMKNGELDFFKSTITSKNASNIFMYNEMPMEDMSKDVAFVKKWIFAIAMCLKNGLYLNIIHNLNRPFNELLLGLESWIPIYMTGQVTPYYLKNIPNSVFYNALYVSESTALYGSGVKGFHEKCKYELFSDNESLAYYRTMAGSLLEKASPLMNIYTESNTDAFLDFLNSEKKNPKNMISAIDNENLKNTFKNIDFTICKNKWVMLTKKKNPKIYFVIHHPTLRKAIEAFVTPIVEG